MPIVKESTKYTLPEDWPYQDARQLFFTPDVADPNTPECDFKWEPPDIDGLVQFLVTEKGFSEERVRNGAARLTKNLKSAQQSRLDVFFKSVPKSPGKTDSTAAVGRKKQAGKDADKKKPQLGKVTKGAGKSRYRK